MKAAFDSAGLGRLQRLVDWSPYRAADGDPPWLKRVSTLSSTRVAVLALLGPSGLGVGKVRPPLDPATLYLVGVADWVHTSGQAVSVGLPAAAPQIPLLIAATSVLAETVHESGGQLIKRRGVLLVSPDLDLRSKYCLLTVDREALESAHPGSRMRPDGTRVALARNGDLNNGGVCFFLPAGPLPRSIRFKPGLVVVDLRYARWAPRCQEFAAWARQVAPCAGILALYTYGDRDTLRILANQGFTDFPWDHAAVAAADAGWAPRRDEPDSSLRWNLSSVPTFLDRTHEIVEITRPETVSKLVNGLARILEDQEKVDAPDLRRARWLLAVMQQMTVPITWYETTARDSGRSTLRRMIARLGSSSISVPDGLGPVIQTMRLTFEQLYQTLETDNRRADALLVELRRRAENGRVLVLVRDKVLELATRAWMSVDALADFEWLDRISVFGCPRLEAHLSHRFDTAIVNGAVPRRYRWIVGAELPQEVIFLCYPEESDVVQSQLETFYDPRYFKACARARHTLLAGPTAVLDAENNEDVTVGLPPNGLVLIRPPRARPLDEDVDTPEKFHRVEGGLKGLRAALEESLKEREASEQEAKLAERSISWFEDATDDEAHEEESSDVGVRSEPDDVWCRVLHVNSRAGGRGRLFLPENVPVEFVRLNASTDIKKALPGDLTIGDVILRVEDGRRAGLFDRIVELAEKQPRMQLLGSYRTRWHTAMTRLSQRYADGSRIRFDRMLTDLQVAGAPIESELAVRWWVQGLVIGPESIQSIAAVGHVLEDQTLVDAARQFDKAFRQIRGIRQGIGRRLSTAIRRSFSHLEFDGAVQVDDLDDALGLPLDELLETIDLAEVVEVGERHAAAPQIVGKFFRGEA